MAQPSTSDFSTKIPQNCYGLSEELLKILRQNPYQNPPPYEKLVGDLAGAYSRRINIQHRLAYQVLETEQTVKVLRMWSHYE